MSDIIEEHERYFYNRKDVIVLIDEEKILHFPEKDSIVLRRGESIWEVELRVYVMSPSYPILYEKSRTRGKYKLQISMNHHRFINSSGFIYLRGETKYDYEIPTQGFVFGIHEFLEL